MSHHAVTEGSVSVSSHPAVEAGGATFVKPRSAVKVETTAVDQWVHDLDEIERLIKDSGCLPKDFDPSVIFFLKDEAHGVPNADEKYLSLLRAARVISRELNEYRELLKQMAQSAEAENGFAGENQHIKTEYDDQEEVFGDDEEEAFDESAFDEIPGVDQVVESIEKDDGQYQYPVVDHDESVGDEDESSDDGQDANSNSDDSGDDSDASVYDEGSSDESESESESDDDADNSHLHKRCRDTSDDEDSEEHVPTKKARYSSQPASDDGQTTASYGCKTLPDPRASYAGKSLPGSHVSYSDKSPPGTSFAGTARTSYSFGFRPVFGTTPSVGHKTLPGASSSVGRKTVPTASSSVVRKTVPTASSSIGRKTVPTPSSSIGRKTLPGVSSVGRKTLPNSSSSVGRKTVPGTQTSAAREIVPTSQPTYSNKSLPAYSNKSLSGGFLADKTRAGAARINASTHKIPAESSSTRFVRSDSFPSFGGKTVGPTYSNTSRSTGPSKSHSSSGKTTAPSKSRSQTTKKGAWTDDEYEAIFDAVKTRRDYEEEAGEKKLRDVAFWTHVSNELRGCGYERTHSSCKNFWSREGRLRSGFEERINPPGDGSLVSSAQIPKKKRTVAQDDEDEF